MTGQKGRVLVVDDDHISRKVLTLLVENIGYQVEQAADGKTALRMAHEGYDCILLDLVMPEMDGMEVLMHLKQDQATMHVPVIVISGNDDLYSASRSIGMGAIDFIQKPVNATLLSARLKTSLSEKRIRDLEKQHLQDMRLAQARMAAVIGDSPLGVIIMGLDMMVREVNPTFMRMMGADDQAPLLGPIEQYCANLDHSCKAEMARFLTGHMAGPFYKEATMRRVDGTTFDVQMTMSSVRAEGDPDAFAVAMVQDITERKMAEAELRSSQHFLSKIFQTSPNFIYIFDLKEHRNIYANREILDYLGYTPQQIRDMGPRLFEIILHPDDLKGVEAQQERLRHATDGHIEEAEYRLRKADGNWYWIRSRDVVFDRDPDGSVRSELGIAQDVSKEKMAEEALRQSEESLRLVVASAPFPILITDMDGTYIIDANQQAISAFGLEAGKHHLAEIFAEEAGLMAVMDAISGKGSVDDVEVALWAKGGERRWAILSARTISYHGEHQLVLATYDITDRRRIERALQQANAKLGIMNSITRHDIINQMTALNGFLELCKMREKDRALLPFFERMSQAARNVQMQISFTKDYQDMGAQAAEWCDIGTTFRTSFDQLGPKGVDMEACDGYEVLADRMLQKVFYNLIDNSIRHGEYVTNVRLECSEDAEGLVVVYSDNGCGVSDRDRPQLFDKGFGKNTGLGLFLTKEILSITNISISENGSYGHGARFEMRVPKENYRKI